jgi:hypothetical protein
MNLMELLNQVDARLRPLVGAEDDAVQAVVDEVAAGPRPRGVSPDSEPRAVLAGRLVSIEEECRMLRERLGVTLTTVARLDVKFMSVSGSPGNGSDEPHQPD